MTGQTRDVLREVADEVRGWCGERAIAVVAGVIEVEGSAVVVLDASEPGGWRHFATAVEAVGAKLVTLSAPVVEREDLEVAVAHAERLSDATTREASLDELREQSERAGQTYCLWLAAWSPNGCVLKWEYDAEWTPVIFDTRDNDDDDDDDDDDDEFESSEFEEASREQRDTLIDSLAHRLAEMPEFQQTRNSAARYYTARRLLGADAEPIRDYLHAVANAAWSIWQAEIKPQQEAELRQRALQLVERGEPRPKVAAALGISVRRLRDMIG